MSCLTSTSTRVSVGTEVAATSKWLLIGAIVESFCYYHTAHQRNDDIMWVTAIFAGLLVIMIYVHLHRMKVAQIKLRLDEGDNEWSNAVCAFTLSTSAFFALIIILVLSEPRPFEYVQRDNTWCMEQPWDWSRVYFGGTIGSNNEMAKELDAAWCAPNFGNATQLCLRYSPFEQQLLENLKQSAELELDVLNELEQSKKAGVTILSSGNQKADEKEIEVEKKKQRLLHAELLRKKFSRDNTRSARWKSIGAGWTFFLLFIATLFQFATFVYIVRFERKADDRFAAAE